MTLEDRKKAFENKYAHDAELNFKIQARRNRLLGLWAALKMGLANGDAESYAKDVVASDFDRPGDEDVFEKVWADLSRVATDISQEELREQMDSLLLEAKQQLLSQ